MWLDKEPVAYTCEVGEHKEVDVKVGGELSQLYGPRTFVYWKCRGCGISHFAFAGMGSNLDAVSCPPPEGYFD